MPRWSLLEIIQYKTLIAKILINFVQSLQENKIQLQLSAIRFESE